MKIQKVNILSLIVPGDMDKDTAHARLVRPWETSSNRKTINRLFSGEGGLTTPQVPGGQHPLILIT